jgi:hypothetical protein
LKLLAGVELLAGVVMEVVMAGVVMAGVVMEVVMAGVVMEVRDLRWGALGGTSTRGDRNARACLRSGVPSEAFTWE